MPVRVLAPGLIVSTLIIGALIELIQHNLGRSADISDILRDLTGTLLGLAFLNAYSSQFEPKLLRIFRIFILILLAFQLNPLARALLDEVIGYLQFPILVSNSTPLELDRWRGNAALEYDRLGPDKLLKMVFVPRVKYTGSSLRYFPGDWSGYESLNIRLFNPSDRPLELQIKIHDREHEESFQYRDRFNQQTQVNPGWSYLKIALADIKDAPQNRKMNMQEISNLSVFTSLLSEQTTVLIEKIYLSE